MAQQQTWSADNWQWDSRNFIAAARQPVSDKPCSQDKSLNQSGEASTSSSPTTSGDQASKGAGRSKGGAVCQVEGCNTNVAGLKEYHNRYKICEFHLKNPCIVREGTTQRFCQQCGRFHNIGEFDGDKRSCRARLQRHNARRRKNGSEPAKVTKRASSNRHLRDLAAPPRGNSPASDDAKAAASGSTEPMKSQNQQFWPQAEVQSQLDGPHSGWSSCAMNTSTALDNAFADFLKQESAQPAMAPTSVPSFHTAGSQPSALTQQMVMEDLLGDGQSSLHNPLPSSDAVDVQYLTDILSTPADLPDKPPQQLEFYQQASKHNFIGPIHMMHRQELITAHQRGYAQGQQQQQQQLQQPLASWCKPPDMAAQGMDVGFDEPSFGQDLSSMQAGRHLLSISQPEQPALQIHMAQKNSQSRHPASFSASAAAADLTPQPAPVLEQAQDLLAFNDSQAKYIPEEHFIRMSAKLFNCTPEHLPGDLKQNLVGLLSCGVDHIEGFIAPGCLQLTVDAMVTAQQLEAMQGMTAGQAAQQLLRGQNRAFWGSDAMLLQWQDELVLVKEGKVEHVISGAGSKGLLPHIHSMTPVCVSRAHVGAVTITGSNIAGRGQTVFCRSQGAYLPVEVTRVAASGAGGQQLSLQLPPGLDRGALQIEIAQGGFISHAQPILVLDNEEAVAEIMQLKNMPLAGADLSAVLRDMGRVLEHSSRKQAEASSRPADARELGTQDSSLALTAKRLLSFACRVGWSAVSELLLPIASDMTASASELVAELETLADEGLTLLHHAVRSRNVALVSLLLTWGINNGHVWDYTAAGPAGLTVLHLAALLNDGGKVADELTDVFADALTCWSSWEAQDGSTAAELAHKSGAQSINAMIQRKLDGQSSGLMAQSFDFDPETGEWIDGDDVCDDAEANVDDNSAALVDDDATAHRQYQTEKGLSKSGRLDESAPLIVPARPSNTTLAAEESISQYGSPQTSRIEAAESLLAMSSPSSSGYGDELRKSAEFNAVLTQGLRCQMKAKGFSGGAYSHDDDMFLEQKIHGKKAVPDVFDGRAALVSSAIVGAVGICALGLRCCFEYYDI